MQRASAILVGTFVLLVSMTAMAQSYIFTYQGKLNDGGAPANGVYDIRITQLEAIDQPAGTDTIFDNVQVTNGIFTVDIRTGALILIENRLRFLEIAVRPGNSEGAFSVLSPRQAVNMVPYAGRSASAAEANYAVNATNVSGGTVSGNGAGITNLNGSNIALGTVGPEQLAPNLIDAPKRNASLLASKRWDVLRRWRTFPVGTSPHGITFDGKHIWTANSGSNNITKLDPTDGSIVGTYPVGLNPRGIVYDGSNIWVANFGSNNVSKIRASDGSILGTYSVGNNPIAIAFDGTDVWVTNSASNSVTRLSTSDGSVVETIDVGVGPVAIVFDGYYLWTANTGNSVTRIRVTGGSSFGTFPLGALGNGTGIEFDGTHIYALTQLGNVVKIKPSDGSIISSFLSNSLGFLARSILFDGTSLWVSHGNGQIHKLRISDGALLAEHTALTDSRGLVFDGINVWATGAQNVAVRLPPAFPEP